MNWDERYATRNIPPNCPFCQGVNHLLKSAVKWTPETGKQTGLPRPSIGVDPELQEQFGVKRTIPIPWNTDPALFVPMGGETLSTLPTPDRARSMRCIKEHLCPMCGEGFEPDETVSRWKREYYGGSGSLSDSYPLHKKCMKVAMIHCPHFKDERPDNFETGPYAQLRASAEKEMDELRD